MDRLDLWHLTPAEMQYELHGDLSFPSPHCEILGRTAVYVDYRNPQRFESSPMMGFSYLIVALLMLALACEVNGALDVPTPGRRGLWLGLVLTCFVSAILGQVIPTRP